MSDQSFCEASQQMINAALAYRSQGHRPIPVKAGTKKARVSWKTFQTRPPTEEEIHRWWDYYPNDGIALVTGEGCGTVVIDTDGPRGAALVELLAGPVTTPASRTGGGGLHQLYQHPGGRVKTRANILPEVDVRADGGYIVVSPSTHPTGTTYHWVAGRSPSDVAAAPLPEPLLALLTAESSAQANRVVAKLWEDKQPIHEGTRNQTLTQIAGKLIGAGCPLPLVIVYLMVVNAERCQPPVETAELETIAHSIAVRETAKSATVTRAGRKLPSAKPRFQSLKAIAATATRWLWPGYLPLGKLTLFLGDPSVGKSTLATTIAAQVTIGGAMPDGSRVEVGGAILLSPEDGAADTLRPRLEAAGGDPDRVVIMASGEDTRQLVLPHDIDTLRDVIRDSHARIVLLDPLVQFLPPEINSWNDQHVRQALAPMAALAEETNVAMVVVSHLNKKAGATPMYRTGGSIGIVAATRAAFLVAKHPNDPQRRVLAPVKFNLGREPQSLMFRVVDADNGSSRIVWEGTTPLTADTLLEPPKWTKEDHAVELLQRELANGSQPTKVVEERAKEAGISKRTLARARKRAAVQCERNGFQSAVHLVLPSDATSTAAEPEEKSVAHNGNSGVPSPLGLDAERPSADKSADSAYNANTLNDREQPSAA